MFRASVSSHGAMYGYKEEEHKVTAVQDRHDTERDRRETKIRVRQLLALQIKPETSIGCMSKYAQLHMLSFQKVVKCPLHNLDSPLHRMLSLHCLLQCIISVCVC